MSLITSLKLPPLEELTSEEGYTLEPLGKDTDLYRQLKSDFEEAGLAVKSVEHLTSFHNWHKYTTCRKVIEERKPQRADYKLNETFLYHGTSADKDNLCEEGFDVNLASDGCFGRGLYFSDSASKCEKYSRRSGTMLVARVILGTIKEYADKDKDHGLVREPEKENPDGNEWRFYDSVKGRPRNHMEYVIYRSERALIEYIVTFSKAGDDVQAPSPVPQKSVAGAKTPDEGLKSATEVTKSTDSDSDPEDTFEDAKNDGDEDKDFKDVPSASSSDDDEDIDFKDVLSASSSDDDEDIEFKDVPKDLLPDCFKKKLLISESAIPFFVITSGELSLEQKKKEFVRVTAEQDDDAVESILKKTDEDLERAIYLFYAQKQVKEEEEKRQRGEMVDDYTIEDDGSPIFPLMEPEYESEGWNRLNEDEKKSKMDTMVKDFLVITALEELHIQIASNYVSNAKYNLDTAVINYYKSWF